MQESSAFEKGTVLDIVTERCAMTSAGPERHGFQTPRNIVRSSSITPLLIVGSNLGVASFSFHANHATAGKWLN